MGKTHQFLSEQHIQWLSEQKVFFVASAAKVGHVNVSPKGHTSGTFAVLSPTRVAYLDFTGSGSETAAHAAADGRITILFVAFKGAPQIIRIYGTARVVQKANVGEELKSHFSAEQFNDHGARAVVIVDADRISTSCGYSIPTFEYVEERFVLHDIFKKMTPEELAAYRLKKNSFSIDGMPSIGHRSQGADAPVVAARLTDGFWFGYTDPSIRERVCSWLGVTGPLATLRRDLFMMGMGAFAATLLLRYRSGQLRIAA